MFNLCGDNKHSFTLKVTAVNLDVSCEVLHKACFPLGFLTQRLVDNVAVFVDDLSGLYLRAAVLRFLRTQAVSFLIFFAACWECSHVTLDDLKNNNNNNTDE